MRISRLISEFTENVGESPTYYDEFWVKVALIAVPLCGGIILVALVVLACKILQRDSKYEAHLRSSSSGYMQCHGADGGANANRHSKARLLLLEDGSPTSEKHVKNSIYKGPQDHKVITWVIASQGEKPSPV
jgi:BMP and activin membrane-bound inhibitor homolog C-terminus